MAAWEGEEGLQTWSWEDGAELKERMATIKER